MIKFRQKLFLKPITRFAAKSHRFGRRVGLLNPLKYTTKTGRDSFNREIRAIKGDIRLANRKASRNAKDAISAIQSTAQLDIPKAGKHVGNIIDRTPTAAIGPAIPVPGATEALGVTGPYLEQFVPGVREATKVTTDVVKGGVTKFKRLVK